MITVSKRSGFKRTASYMKRNVLNYRYLKRNILVGLSAVGVLALTFGVVKYGERIDHESEEGIASAVEYADAAFMKEDSIATAMDNLYGNSVQVADNDSDMLMEAEDETSEFDNKFIVKTDDILNVRAETGTDSEIVGKMENGAVGDITGVEGEWTAISSGNVCGYVKSEYILTGDEAESYASDYVKTVGTVNTDTVRIRSEATTESDILALAAINTKLDVISESDGWVEVELSETESGYIMSDYIDVEKTYATAMTLSEYDALYNAPEDEQVTQDETASGEASEENNKAKETVSDNTTSSGASSDNKPETKQEESVTAEEKPEQAETVDTGGYSDAYLLACLVSMEAGYESYEGQLAVANVVLNRLKSGKWGSTLADVIYAPNQFPCATGSVMQGYLDNGPLETAVTAANDALNGNNNIGGYMSFLNKKYVDTDSLADYVIIGNHCFY